MMINGSNIKNEIERLIGNSITKCIPDWLNESKKINISNCSQSKFGDYTCYTAIEIFRSMPKGAFENKKEVAEVIISGIEENQIIGEVKATSQGYINIFLSNKYLSINIEELIKNGEAIPPEISKEEKSKKVIIDFSSPNIAKEMHVGHLRSTILGESIARTLEYCGYDVVRVNHLGDWGTQFGMLICYLKENYPDFIINTPEIGDLQNFYKLAKAKFDKDSNFKEKSRNEVVKLQSGDIENLAAWKIICKISENEFEKIYKKLNISLTAKGESFYNSMIPDVVKELEDKNLITMDGGAKLLFVPGHAQPMMVVKSDGGYTYDTTDLAALKYRLHTEKANWIIYVVDAGQSSHFHLLFEAARLAGWYDPKSTRLDHVGFGLVCGDDGKKFKTRSGKTVKLASLLDEAVIRAKQEYVDRQQEQQKVKQQANIQNVNNDCNSTTITTTAPCLVNSNDDNLADIDRIASVIGYSAVRYADLKIAHGTNYVFSYSRMLDLKGNTALYLLYSYARICSILSKSMDKFTEDLHSKQQKVSQSVCNSSEFNNPSPNNTADQKADCDYFKRMLSNVKHIHLDDQYEIKLARNIINYTTVIQEVFTVMDLHNVCAYVYNLCCDFSLFHLHCRVLDHKKEKHRILLCYAVKLVISAMLYLLGIVPLEKI